MGGAYFLLLYSLALAVTIQAQDCTTPVGTDMSLKDEYITLTEFPDGITVVFACNVGYEPAGGSGRITCTKGTWSRLTLKCQKKSCGSAGEIENGVINYDNGNEFGDIATVTCNRGYNLVGNRELFCGDQGWMNRLPVCEVINCDPPSKIVDGTFDPVKESYAYSDVVKYTCVSDYTLNGSAVLSCSDSGKFTPNPPKCTRVECTEPQIKNAYWKAGSRPPYRYKSSVTYECEKGFTMKGDSTITCDINSQWSPRLPECTRIPTTAATTTTTTTTKAPIDKTPDNGGDNSASWGYAILAVGAAVVAAIVGKIAYDRKKKRERISHQDKKPTNNGDAELCPINDTADLKDDVTEQMNSVQ